MEIIKKVKKIQRNPSLYFFSVREEVMKKWSLFLLMFLWVLFSGKTGFADDTDIYSLDRTVQPNVLIIFDNSGSMSEGVPFNYLLTYTGLYDVSKIYERRCAQYFPWGQCRAWSWQIYTGTFIDANNDGIHDSSLRIRTGNRLNYDNSPSVKINVAKDAVKTVIDNVDNVRFGLMIFQRTGNMDEGGEIIADCGTDKATIKSRIDSFSPQTWTPLAETLSQAGQYFEGTFPGHSSPSQFSCQPNYVIIMTDGKPTHDMDFTILSHFLGSNTGRWDQNNDPSNDVFTSDNLGEDVVQHYLDDVAKYLFTHDLKTDLIGIQRVITYTIGFATDHPLLEKTAAEGGGKYLTANNADQLYYALESYLVEITNRATIFVAPVVPATKTTSGNRIYVPFAYPNSVKSFWEGDVKKYGINPDGTIVDKNNIAATDSSGNFLDTSQPFWSVNEMLKSRTTPRNIYTRLFPSGSIYGSQNEFSVGNSNLTSTILGNSTYSREQIIGYVRGEDVFDEDGDGITQEKRDYLLGDVLHSSPVVVKYEGSTMLYFGANDGMLHAVNDSDGSERWAFILPDLLPKLKNMVETRIHQYYVDGSPKLVALNSQNRIAGPTEPVARRIIIFGERKGGSYYYALDVTNPDQPEYLWEISPSTTGFSELGETWSEPFFGPVKEGTVPRVVAFFGGGYQADNLKGRGVYAVDVLTGELVWSKTSATVSGMGYSIPGSFTGVDVNDDGFIDRAYIGDLGGQMWAFALFPVYAGDPTPQNGNVSSWGARLLFKSNSASE